MLVPPLGGHQVNVLVNLCEDCEVRHRREYLIPDGQLSGVANPAGFDLQRRLREPRHQVKRSGHTGPHQLNTFLRFHSFINLQTCLYTASLPCLLGGSHEIGIC